MSLTTIPVEVDKEAYEISQALVMIVADVKKAVSDGVQPSDIAPIVTSVIAHLADKIAEFQMLAQEAKANQTAFAKALAISASDMYEVMRG